MGRRLGVALFLTACAGVLGAVGCSDDLAIQEQEAPIDVADVADAGARADAAETPDRHVPDASADAVADAASEDAPTVEKEPPTAKNDAYEVLAGGTLTTTATAPHCDAYEPLATDGVLANDCGHGGSALSVTLVSGPANAASFTLNADGSFVYVPSGVLGADSFTYSVSDGELSATATASITVRSCAATLEAHGCEFLAGPGIWNCGSKDLQNANLSGCNLTNASFFNANLSGAKLHETNLTGANFFASTVTNAKWKDTTCPSGTNSAANNSTCCGQFILGQVPGGC